MPGLQKCDAVEAVVGAILALGRWIEAILYAHIAIRCVLISILPKVSLRTCSKAAAAAAAAAPSAVMVELDMGSDRSVPGEGTPRSTASLCRRIECAHAFSFPAQFALLR
jgi:hypothetical protein